MLSNVSAISLYYLLGALALLSGACIGSYLNVCIYRIPRELSTVTPRSHCPGCKKLIPWYYNIPLLSYLMLGGRCKFCKEHITIRYFLVEAMTGTLFFLVFIKFDMLHRGSPLGIVPMSDWKLLPVYWLMISGLILGSFVDFEHLIIPDRVTIGGTIAGLVLSALVPSMHSTDSMLHSIILSAIGAATGFAILWGIAQLGKFIFKKDAMGFGDVKLISAIGAFLGWEAVLFNVIASSFLGSIVGITLVFCGKKEMQSRIPYGPYIALAALLWIFWGAAWWQAYLDLIFVNQTVM